MEIELFRDRIQAGRVLADRLAAYKDRDAWVLAIPRGGVPVGYQVAQCLNAHFDVVVPRKIPIPWNPEAGFGAVTADGSMVLNETMVRGLGLRQIEIDQAVEEVRREVVRRTAQYRGDRPVPDVQGKQVIIVDDGLASGYTMLAAIQSIRRLEPSEVIVAVPVASSGSVRSVSRKADKLVAVIVSERLPFAVASYYTLWDTVTDEEACVCLARAWKETSP